MTPHASPPATIHVVDDDASFRTAIARLVRAGGHEVRGYPSAVEFLAAPAGASPGCVLVGLHMPGPFTDMLMGYSKNQKPAKDFLRWMHSKPVFGQWFTSQQGYACGATKSWETHDVWNLDPVLKPFHDLPSKGRLAGYAGPPDRRSAEVVSKYIIVDMYAKAIQGMPAEEAAQQTTATADSGQGKPEDLDLLLDLSEQMTGRTICVLSDSCAAPVVSAIKKFRPEFDAYLKSGRAASRG